MSHRKGSKRRREADGDEDFSPSFPTQKKRSKSHREVERNDSPLQHNLFLDETDTGVRRSSRTPKPKVFDDEETAVIDRTAEASSSSKPGDSGLIQPVERPSSSSKQITHKRDDASISRKQRKANPVVSYNEGHKRETRRSYQSYLEELKIETDVLEQPKYELGSADQTESKKQQRSHERKIVQSHSARRNSDANGQLGADATPKSSRIVQKTPKEKGTSKTRTKEPSPKVRTSSRTPVPKRVFSLLEKEESEEEKSDVSGSPKVENDSFDLNSSKIRSSSRAHVPKKSFPLLEKEESINTKPDVSEHALAKARTPKLQGSKRRLSAVEERNDLDLSKITPATPDEPSPKVRISTRGHKPKRTFSLLEGNEAEEESNVSKDVHEEEKFVIRNLIEQQKSAITNKEPKRRKSSNGQQLSQPQSSSSKEELKSPSNHGTAKSGHVLIKVEESDVSRASSAAGTSVKTPGSSKVTGEKSLSEGSNDAHDKGKLNKRKGKPVKKKLASSEEAQIPTLSLADLKVKIEAKLTANETLVTPKAIKPKGSSKKKQANESSKKQSQGRHKSVVKQESAENKKGFSLSDIAKDVIDSSAASNDLNTTISKVERKGKLSKTTEQKAVKDKVIEKAKKDRSNSSKTKEQKHIILKLQLPQSEDSTKHKKHHHHHHHHKHKHSSGNHEDGSPRKSHHKKSAAKLADDNMDPKNSLDPDGNKKAMAKKKKKISIKFKGLSNIDVDMADNSNDQSDSVGLDTSKQQSKENVKKKKSKMVISQDEGQLLTSSQSESERVKLVIKKDKIPPDSKSEEVKKKKSSKPTAPAASVDRKKKPTSATKSKKGKASSTPGKSNKSPQKPKTVTSYLLFCKQHRKKIVEENPGLEFTEISKKVGIAWNNLADEDKEYWRQKAEEVKKSLGISSSKTVTASKEDKAEPVDLAAHLQLLGESLCTVGACLRVQDPGEVHGSLSVLLDSALCAISPLLFLTSQIPEMNGCSRKTQAEVLDNLAYLMPGLG